MKNLWLKIPATIRAEIRSVLITFISVFILTVALQLSQNDIAFKADAIMALAIAAMRAGIKAVATLVVSFLTPAK
jgi:hypothetical protein